MKGKGPKGKKKQLLQIHKNVMKFQVIIVLITDMIIIWCLDFILWSEPYKARHLQKTFAILRGCFK